MLFGDFGVRGGEVEQGFELVAGGGGMPREVVVEEGVEGDGFREFRLEPGVPFVEEGGYVGLEVGFALERAMPPEETQVEEVGSTVEAGFHNDVLGGDPADIVGVEHLGGGGGVPRAVAEFDGVAGFVGEGAQERVHFPGVGDAGVKFGGELDEDGAEFFFQQRDRVHEFVHHRDAVFETRVMGDRARGFRAEDEAVRGLLAPALDDFRARRAVEGGVHFDGVEDLAVKSEVSGRAGVGGVEVAEPVFIAVAHGAEVKGGHRKENANEGPRWQIG